MQSKFSELFPIKGFLNLLFAQHCLVHCRAGGLLPRRIGRPDIDSDDDVNDDDDDDGDGDDDCDEYGVNDGHNDDENDDCKETSATDHVEWCSIIVYSKMVMIMVMMMLMVTK